MRRAILLIATLSLGACAKFEPVVTRFDGAAPDMNSPAYRAAMVECDAKARVAASQLPYAHGHNGGITYEMEKINVAKAAARGCLAEKGYAIDWVKKDA